MKKLIIINGTMGVGKSTISSALNRYLSQSVYLDGDWCWHMNPFIVNDETKKMVVENITFQLNNFLKCQHLDYVIFCWVIHEEYIFEEIISHLKERDFELYFISLVCSEQQLRMRLEKDLLLNIRDQAIIDKSVSRLEHYQKLSSTKIDVGEKEVNEIVLEITQLIGAKNEDCKSNS